MIKQRSDWYFISAGEHSGDLLAANLVLSLREENPDLQAFGIAGDAMRAARVDPVLDIAELAVMGIVDVIKKLADLRILEKQILQRIDDRRPAFAVLVDFPGLHFRLAEQLRLRNIPVIQYVAPKVWAWGEKRVRNLREDFDLVLGVLPFEEEFFLKHGVNYKFIGSPHKDRTSKVIVDRAGLGLPNQGDVIGLLPGSRKTELQYIIPKMIAVVQQIRQEHPEAHFIMPLAKSLERSTLSEILPYGYVLSETDGNLSFAGINVVHGMSLEIMAVADVAVVASGTATLECALLGTPMVVMYVVDQSTYDLAKNAIKVPYISLVNLMVGRPLVREFVQKFNVRDVARCVTDLLNPHANERMREELCAIRDRLPGNAAHNAAQEILDFLRGRNAIPG